MYYIDALKILKVKNPDKELTEVAATGAPYGKAHKLNPKEMMAGFAKNDYNKLHILEPFKIGKIRIN